MPVRNSFKFEMSDLTKLTEMFSTPANFLLASPNIPSDMSANTMFLYPSFANRKAQSPVPAPASRMREDFLLGAYFLRKCHVIWLAKYRLLLMSSGENSPGGV